MAGRVGHALVVVISLLTAAGSFAGEGKQLLWGDTHLHTNNSMDAFTVGNLTGDPETAYRYAKGLPVIHPYHRARVRIGKPLDFLVVSDHAEFMGVIRHLYTDSASCEKLGPIDTLTTALAGWILRLGVDHRWGSLLFGSYLPEPEEASAAAGGELEHPQTIQGVPPLPCVEAAAWNATAGVADAYNQPGEFSALIGWEWTSTPGGANLHRVVITDGGADSARLYSPYSFLDSPYPEDLWRWLDQTSARVGADFIAIPHNSNLSKGYMFDTKTLRGSPLSPDYVAARIRWERVAEVTQIKGDSETHPQLSPEDRFADFETFPFYLQRLATDYVPGAGDYIRGALRRGLALEEQLGRNPFQFGLIGSTDAHTALASAEEDNFHGKMAQDSVPETKGSHFANSETAPSGWDMSASGLAAVWARENTREAILAALKRREVYATSGPRISVQFFAGYGLSETLLQSGKDYALAASSGVPMGGELSGAAGEVPRFVVLAARDPSGANLDRVQIVKGWIDADGTTHEKVFDVAWSGERVPDAAGRIPDVGNSVDVSTASYSNDIGAPELAALWRDPEFDAAQSAFYYARVLQIPTPRHSLYDAVALREAPSDRHPAAIQERAYTSPIWYRPNP
jgi:hypothetical protein